MLLSLRMGTKGIRPNGKEPYERTDATILVPVFLSGNRRLAYRYICNEPDLPQQTVLDLICAFCRKRMLNTGQLTLSIKLLSAMNCRSPSIRRSAAPCAQDSAGRGGRAGKSDHAQIEENGGWHQHARQLRDT